GAPPSRLAKIVRDCEIRTVVSDETMRARLTAILESGGRFDGIIGLDDSLEDIRSVPAKEIANQPDHDVAALGSTELDIAYIIYTSGTTGAPKGITHSHRGSLSFVEWAAAEFELSSEDRLSNHAPLHFDLSTFDFFAAHAVGATTVIIPEAHAKLPASLSQLMEEERITVWYSVPAALIQLLLRGGLEKRQLSRLRWILFGGEAFPVKHLRDLMHKLPSVRFTQLYGVTETNVCTVYHLSSPPEEDESVPIGHLLPNMEALVVDGSDEPVQPGAAGELLVRAPATMIGYWGRSELTSRAFLRRSVTPGITASFYRTGDLVRQLPNGDFVFLGRRDRQVKTRGFRVELDEIEAALLSHSDIQEAAAFATPDEEGSHRIEAAVVSKGPVAEMELFKHLKSLLPPYALPMRLSIVERLPRTSTGKVDLQALTTTSRQEARS
ncbi:MAG: amino acid adenylation domain-containing protein, partial [Rhodothermales bacterium]|nr:amino acid adenylation domain-containing protein [Rhodothermales bacterium]